MPTTAEIRAQVEASRVTASDASVRADLCELLPSSTDACRLRDALGNEPSLSAFALGQLLAKLSIPAAFFHRCPTDLQKTIADHFLHESGPRRILVLRRRHLPEGVVRIRAVLSNRYTPYDDHVLLPTVLDILGLHNARHDQFIKTEELTLLRSEFQDLCSGHSVGDKPISRVYAGISVRNSEVGYSALYIEPCVLVGGVSIINPYATRSEALNRYMHTTSGLAGLAQIEKLTELVTSIRTLAQLGVLQAVEAQLTTISNPLRTLEEFVEESGYLSKRFTSMVMEQIEDEVEVSRFRLGQAILQCCGNLPLISQYETQARVGRWMGLFEDTDRFGALGQEL